MVGRNHNTSAADCLELWYQHSDCLKGLLTKAPLRCELMRSENTLVYFIEQQLAERLEVTESFVDD
jgi:hypothetical protein